jgi:hypothetical protein
VDGGDDLVTFMSRQVGPAFDVRRIVLAPGSERACEEDEWSDALVVVEHGTIEVACLNDCRATFVKGDILCLGWLEPRAIRNRGSDVAVLAAVSRRGRSRMADRTDRMNLDG